MPKGFSRMVTETVGDERFLAESGFLRAIRPELVVALVTFLASNACTFTHRNYSAAAGSYARVFVGSFQAVQHLCVDMYESVELARSGVVHALWAADDADPGDWPPWATPPSRSWVASDTPGNTTPTSTSSAYWAGARFSVGPTDI